MTPQEQKLMDEIAALRAENAKLAANRPVQRVTIKVADKGGISLYGMGRFPVTLYAEQWAKVIAMGDQITKFAADHADEIAANVARNKAAKLAEAV